MKKNLLVLLAMFIGFGLSAQIYEENFDSFADGDYLAVVDADNWTTWSDAPGTAEDAMISDAFAASAPNAVLVTGTTDAVYPCGDATSGAYVISFDFYVPAGMAGYYNVQHVFASEWAAEIYLHADGTSRIIAGGQEITPSFDLDTWFNVTFEIDMNTDWADMYWDDELIIGWQWSLNTDGTAGTMQLGCVNMYAGAENGETPEYYFDNFMFDEMALVLYGEDFDDFADGDYLAVVDPENWTTWSDAPGTAEDGLISDDQSETAPNSVVVEGTTDLVFPFGDKTSGSYEVDFDMYVPGGMAGYYNLQHVFASEWCVEVYLHADGSSRIIAGGQEITPSFDLDTWFNVFFEIDLDEDLATMYWDDAEIISWQWSLNTDGTAGTNQLGCANMYAGAENGETPQYYFDNFEFVSLSSGLAPPTVELDTDEITVTIDDGTAVTETFNIANIGEQDLSYNIYPTYMVPPASGSATGVLAHCDEFNGGVGYTNATSARVAILLGASILDEYIGTEITAIEYYCSDQMLDVEVIAWEQGETTVPGPGEIITSEASTPTIGAWVTVELDEPILLTGEPIYVGLAYFQPAGLFSMGCDAGPKVPGVNWRSTGPGWGELSLDYNYNVRAITTGDPYNTWMDIPVDMGMIVGGSDETAGLFLDPTGLDGATYTGQVVVATNDPVTNYATIDITLTIITGIEDVNVKDAVMLYPNPTNDVVNLKAETQITEVRISNYLGQLVDVQNSMNNQMSIDLSQYDNGVYFVEITTEVGTSTVKVIKK